MFQSVSWLLSNMKVYILFHYRRQPTFCRGVICDSHEWPSAKLQHTGDWIQPIGKLTIYHTHCKISWLRVCNFKWLTNGYCGPYLADSLYRPANAHGGVCLSSARNAGGNRMPGTEHSLDNCSYFSASNKQKWYRINLHTTSITNIDTSSKRFRDYIGAQLNQSD